MGANAVTTFPTYTTGQVLEAADLNITNCGVPTFADTTARDGAFGGTGEKTLAEGQLCYLEDSNIVQYYDGSSWATVGPAADSGLTLISATTIGTTVSSVTITGAFSATYDNYLITVNGGTASQETFWKLTVGATTTGYYYGANGTSYAGVGSDSGAANGAFWYCGQIDTGGYAQTIYLSAPFLADETGYTFRTMTRNTGGVAWQGSGYLNDTTSYTAFTLTTNAGTVSGGTIRVYGHKN